MNYQKKCEEIYYASDVCDKDTEILYRCNRVWDAWNIGTMSEEDFEEVEDTQPQLQDWLRLIKNYRLLAQGEEHYVGETVPDGQILAWHEKGIQVFFNLKTGQPATEADWKALYQIIK